jgi:pyruvate formate lyase activating enzyme
LKEASFYTISGDKVQCRLCPHECTIKRDATGTCGVRRNHNGKLISENYALLSAINFDPIEKKPLYHFYPGSVILSLGSVGCNLKCKCCQNWQISQAGLSDFAYSGSSSPDEIVKMAGSKPGNLGIAYTYNEPTVWFEYMIDTARMVHAAGMKNCMVSNGFINEEPLMELIKYLDAFNIDLKAFNEQFYKTQSGAKLEPVKKTLQLLVKHHKHVEITNLVIPTLNDDEQEFTEMVNWIAKELGKKTVLHLSRYHPMYRLDIKATGSDLLDDFYNIAGEKLEYVYVGNIHIKDYQNTRCAKCGETVIRRTGYFVEKSGINKSGSCRYCGEAIVDMQQ